jgi:hypothetical protein
MRILGKAFIADQVQVDKPETLRLAGLEAGLKKMGLLDDDVVTKLGPVPVPDLDGDDEGASFEA